MFTVGRNFCPVCLEPVSDWSARCPRCRYHPDSCVTYNRAQQDVALVARYRAAPPESRTNRWRRLLPAWLGGAEIPGAN